MPAHAKNLRGDFGLGVHELEAKILSGEARVRRLPELLRESPELGGSELFVLALLDQKIANGVDCRNTCEFHICRESSADDHAYETPPRNGAAHAAIYFFAEAISAREEARPGFVSAAAKLQV